MNTFVIEKVESKSAVRIPTNVLNGEFHSSSGYGASKKAFSSIYRKLNRPNVDMNMIIYLRKTNTTDLLKYQVFREYKPDSFVRGNKIIDVEYVVNSKYLGKIKTIKTSSGKKTKSTKKRSMKK